MLDEEEEQGRGSWTYVEGVVGAVRWLRDENHVLVAAGAVFQLISWYVGKFGREVILVRHESCG